jgi:hypothetical protein
MVTTGILTVNTRYVILSSMFSFHNLITFVPGRLVMLLTAGPPVPNVPSFRERYNQCTCMYVSLMQC